jgi:hypothetical protein
VSTVQLDQTSDQRQPDPQATAALIAAALGLHERLKYAVQGLGLDPDPRITDFDRGPPPRDIISHLNRHLAGPAEEFGGISQQVPHDLPQSQSIPRTPDRTRHQFKP